MVYLAELLVVMTDRLKIVRICARNVRRVYTDTSAYMTTRLSRITQAKRRCFYLTNGYRYGHSCYRRRIGNRTKAFEWHQFQ